MQTTLKTLRRPLAIAVPAALLALPALALSAAPRPGGYSGKTAQHKTVSVRVNDSATRIERFKIAYRLSCDDGSHVNGKFTFTDVRIGRGDRFDARGKDTQDFGNGTATQRVRAIGRFVSRKRVAGFWTAKAKLDDGQTRSCKVRHVRWSARR